MEAFFSENFVAIEDLAKGIIVSKDLDNFVPFVSNRAESASMKSNQSHETDSSRFCNCKVKDIKRTINKTVKTKGESFGGVESTSTILKSATTFPGLLLGKCDYHFFTQF